MLRLAREAAEREGYLAGLQHGTLDGHKTGLIQAENETRAKKEQELDQFIEALVTVVKRTESAIPEWLNAAEEQMALVAMSVVRRILEAELKIDRSSALTIAQEAIRSVGHAEKIRIRLNPFDAPVLEQHRKELLSASANVREIEFVDDQSILGGCIVESTGGIVDASIDSRLRIVEFQVEQEFGKAA